MIFEIWYYKTSLPSDDTKPKPILIIGNDPEDGSVEANIHFCPILTSSAQGKYDVRINETDAKAIGIAKELIIKTTQMYTGPCNLLEQKVGDLPGDLISQFISQYIAYQSAILLKMNTAKRLISRHTPKAT